MIKGLTGKASPRPDWEEMEVRIVGVDILDAGTYRVQPVSQMGRELFPFWDVPAGDFKLNPIHIEISFDVAHDAAAFFDCYCGSEKPFAGQNATSDQCVTCAIRAALFGITGADMYAPPPSDDGAQAEAQEGGSADGK